jgi:hypothetical protein
MTKHPLDGPSEPVPVIDIGTALDLLAAAVADRGEDFVYQPVWKEESRCLTCRYANRGTADCIVGQALAFTGVGVHELGAMLDDGVRDLCLRGDCPSLSPSEPWRYSTRPSRVRIATVLGATYTPTQPLQRSGSSTPTRRGIRRRESFDLRWLSARPLTGKLHQPPARGG